MTDLIQQLEQASAGRRELDAILWSKICALPDFDDLGMAVGWEPRFEAMEDGSVNCWAVNTLSEEWQRRARRPAPYYTTSLDAALPGENIVGVFREYKGENIGKWEALHDTQNGTEKPIVHGWGHTEALARRIAALKAIEAEKTNDG